MDDKKALNELEGFTEAGSASNETWKPENEGDNIKGTYTALKENVGVNKSNIYMIQRAGETEALSVWGSTVLDTKFQEIPIGSIVYIEYLGKVKSKAPQPYKDFKVLYKVTSAKDVFKD